MVLNKRDLERAFSPKVRKVMRLGSASSGSSVFPTSSTTVNTLSSSNIKVYVRVRPLSEREKTQNQRSTIKVLDDTMLIFDPVQETQGFFFHGVKQKSRDIAKRPNKEKQFMFDRIFDSDADNIHVYENSTQGIVSSLLEGYNCSVFVYGATGAGKTHTMLGNKESPGITFLTMTELYRQIEELKTTKDVEIGITYLEVYNENVQDLLNPAGPMHLRDDCNGGVLVAGLKVEKIQCADQLFQLLHRGNANRTQHPTDANAESSRSHAVFQVYVKIQGKTSEEVKISKLSMIDLAGSERAAATSGKGARFTEGSNINKSLLALGNCINNLADGLRHIPYRDSKLTRLLKDSLGGNCKTVMIANVSPSTSSYEDTYNTLRYATRAKSIKTKLTKNVVSVDLRVEHYVKMTNELKKENEVLKEKNRSLERALSHPAVSPQRADPRFTEKLNNLYKEKKQLHTEWLNLEAQLKITQWRIHCKSLAASQMKGQMSQFGVDHKEEIIKNEKSLLQLEGRANSLIGKMTELWHQKTKFMMEEFNQFTLEMEEAKVTKLMQPEANVKELQCQLAMMQIQQNHLQKLLNLQGKRLEDQQMYIDTMKKINDQYHVILQGLNLVTNSMDDEYQMSLSHMKGLKAVSWIDSSDDEESAALSSFSVRPFTNLSLNLHSCALPLHFTVPEQKPPVKIRIETVTDPTDSEPSESNLESTFICDRPNPNLLAIPAPVREHKTVVLTPNLAAHPKRSSGSVVPLRKFTPGRLKVKGADKENHHKESKIKLNPKLLTQMSLTPKSAVPKTALTSRPVNIDLKKTPDSKVSLNGCKMTKEKERIPHHNQHPYVRTIKLKRLGSITPTPSKKLGLPKVMKM